MSKNLNRNWLNRIGVVLACLLFSSNIVSSGQTNGRTLLVGVVTDEIGSYIPFVTVVAEATSERRFETRTDENGLYKLSLEPGIYTIRLARAPFSETVIQRYQIASHVNTMTLDISMVCEECEPVSKTGLPSRVKSCEPRAVDGGTYKWAAIDPLLRDPNSYFGFVLVRPQNVKRDFLVKLATRLKSDYCKAEKLQVVIVDKRRYANSTSLTDYADSRGRIVLMRGFYSFDRVSGRDLLEFSSRFGNPTTENQIDLSKE